MDRWALVYGWWSMDIDEMVRWWCVDLGWMIWMRGVAAAAGKAAAHDGRVSELSDGI